MKISHIMINSKEPGFFSYKSQNSADGNLFVRFKTEAKVLTSDGYCHATPGDFIFYKQQETIEFSSQRDGFKHDFFRFFINDDEQSIFDIPTSTLFTLPLSDKLEEILALINSEYYSVSNVRKESLSLLGKLFLINASEHAKQDKSYKKIEKYSDILKLRMDMLNSPHLNWTVSELASKVLMSPSHFQKIYKKQFGTSCINDLINARVNKAKYFLSYTDKKEAEIAELCGYNNVEHFVRQFKKITRVTPSQFKKLNTQNI